MQFSIEKFYMLHIRNQQVLVQFNSEWLKIIFEIDEIIENNFLKGLRNIYATYLLIIELISDQYR